MTGSPRPLLHRSDLRTLWLLGHPVAHSLSPLIQNTALRYLGERYLYLAADVTRENFSQVLTTLPKLGALGANVTVPHKRQAFEMCDALTARATAIGAVNTLHFREGGIWGDNTDGFGWWTSLLQVVDASCFTKVVIIGAGGAARAVLHTLIDNGFSHIVLLNRTHSRAAALVEEFQGDRSSTLLLESDSLDSFACHLQSNTLVIQTTSVGLTDERSPVNRLENWPAGAFLSELIYGKQTALMSQVRALQGSCADGLGMLCGQAAASLSLWLERDIKEIPLDLMMEVALLA